LQPSEARAAIRPRTSPPSSDLPVGSRAALSHPSLSTVSRTERRPQLRTTAGCRTLGRIAYAGLKLRLGMVLLTRAAAILAAAFSFSFREERSGKWGTSPGDRLRSGEQATRHLPEWLWYAATLDGRLLRCRSVHCAVGMLRITLWKVWRIEPVRPVLFGRWFNEMDRVADGGVWIFRSELTGALAPGWMRLVDHAHSGRTRCAGTRTERREQLVSVAAPVPPGGGPMGHVG
jgi:hypothetical protein